MKKVKFVLYFLTIFVLIFLFSRSVLPSNYVLTGHDSGLPIDAKEFLNTRFFAWDERLNFGRDNSHLFGSIPIHFVDYVSSVVSNVSQGGNWANLFFWLTIMFVAAFIFAYLLRDLFGDYFVFLFPPIAVVNFYIFQSLFILERSKYALFVCTIFLLLLVIKLTAGKIKVVAASAILSISLTLFSGGGVIALPNYGSIFLVIFSTLLFYFIKSAKLKNFRKFLSILSFFGLTAFFWVALNSYQILPSVPGIFDHKYVSQISGREITFDDGTAWVDYISQNTSILNIFRMQGVPSWYKDSFVVDSSHPYASIYLEKPLFIILSFGFPILAILSFILTKSKEQKELILFFGFLGLISIFFAAGSHEPFGFLYKLIYTKIPGFFIFRTPYYKFATSFFISFAVMIAYTIGFIVEKVIKIFKKETVQEIVGVFFASLFVVFWLSYHFVFWNQNIFSWKTGFTNRLSIPNYVYDFKNWSEKERTEGRIFLLPPPDPNNLVDQYDWGYWSLSPLPYVLTTAPTITNEVNLTEIDWVTSMNDAILRKDEASVLGYANKLGIKYILNRHDVVGENDRGNYTDALNSLTALKIIKRFDRWDLYEINGSAMYPIYSIKSLDYVTGNTIKEIKEFSTLPEVFGADSNKINLDNFIAKKLNSYYCNSCQVENSFFSEKLPSIGALPDSVFYYLKNSKEKAIIENSKSDSEKSYNYLYFSESRLSEVKTMVALRSKTRDITKNIEVVINYLNEFIKFSNVSSYSDAELILSKVRPMENAIRGQQTKDSETSDNLLQVLRLLNKIDDDVTRLWNGSYDQLRNNKVYNGIDLSTDISKFYIDKNTLPSDRNGNVLIPKGITYNSDNLNFGNVVNNRWIEIVHENKIKTNGNLVMQFDLPNLNSLIGTSEEILVGGKRECFFDKISSLTIGKSYEILVASSDKIRTLTLLFKKNSFDDGSEIRFNPEGVNTPYRYIYRTSQQYNGATFYLCSDDLDLPKVESVSVYELTSPLIVSSKNVLPQSDNPQIKVETIDSTKYKVTLLSDDPQIIILNNRYSDLWKIIGNNNHFTINGFANAWVVDPKVNKTFVIEYSSQKLFYIGTLVSIISFVGISGLLIFLIIKHE